MIANNEPATEISKLSNYYWKLRSFAIALAKCGNYEVLSMRFPGTNVPFAPLDTCIDADQAYRTAEYYIEDDPPIRFEIDQPHQGLALLLMSFDVEQAVWITAYNPGSQPHSEDDNLTNQMQLLERIETMRLNYFVGHSCDAAGDWFEPGYLVLGMDETVGIELGREFGQHAVVFIQPSGEPKLRRITR